jgi:hypothetical protein
MERRPRPGRPTGAGRSGRPRLDRRAGDPDGDGYLEYQTRSPKGLRNQCWKDSWNSIRFDDGRIAEPPIATCELQDYAYDARRRVARLARLVWDDAALADRLDGDAEALKERFNHDFWSPVRGHHMLALDKGKRQVDAMTSNVGQLLWSGIVDQDRAAGVVDRLMAPDMSSGWGIRTMSSKDAAYNPLEYHNGTVWPHDAALIAEGCAATASARRHPPSRSTCCRRRPPSAIACRRCSPASTAPRPGSRSSTRRSVSPRRGRPAPRCWPSAPCSAWTWPDGRLRTDPHLPEGIAWLARPDPGIGRPPDRAVRARHRPAARKDPTMTAAEPLRGAPTAHPGRTPTDAR